MFSAGPGSETGRGADAFPWRLLRVLTLGLVALAAFVDVSAAGPAIKSLVVKFRDGIVVDPSAGLPAAQHAALSRALQTAYSHVGYTSNGALELHLSTPLALDNARAAVNRVRMLPQVLYARVGPVASAASPGVGAAASAGAPAAAQRPVGRLIVKYRDGGTTAAARANAVLPATQVERLTSLAGHAVAHERAMSGGAYIVRLFQSMTAEQAHAVATRLAADPAIEYAEPDVWMQASLTPDDPQFPLQWHYGSPPLVMGGANLAPAWDISTGAPGIIVAVLDTGVLPAHPDLVGRFIGGYDFVSEAAAGNDGDGRDPDASDPGDWITVDDVTSGQFSSCLPRNSSFHGTHVAGTIAAATDNATGVAGTNWSSAVLPARVLGKCGGLSSDISDAITWSAGLSVPGVPDNPNPARVVNLSLSGTHPCLNSMQYAIDRAVQAGSVVVVSAGNGGVDASGASPANCNGVVAVAATGRGGQQASYTNFGATVAISAPGGSDGDQVLSTINSSATSPDLGTYTYGYMQGTSMAAPHVAGVASLMLSIDPTLTPAQVLAKLESSARPFPTGTVRDCTTALCGAGIVDAAAAVLSVLPRPATTTTLESSANPATAGVNVTFTATVAGTAPTGTASFMDGATAIAGCTAAPLVAGGDTGTAACTTAALAEGTRSITAVYGGDLANAPSTSAVLSQVINPGVPSNALVNGVPVTGLSGSAGTELRYTMNIPAGATSLSIRISGGSGDADLYVRFGSAPTTTSYNCRPYLSGNTETCSFATPQTGTYHVMVRGYTSFSGVSLTGSYTMPSANVGPTANFTFTTSGLTASFTDTSTDSDGTIAARSWDFGDGGTSTATNPSRTYTGAGTYTVTLTVTDNGGGANSIAKSVTVSAAPPPSNTLANGVPVTGLSGSSGTELRYTMTVPAGAASLTVTTAGGSGDADLYLRYDAAPTMTTWNCRPYRPGNNETCTISSPQAGTWHVMVRGYSTFSGVTLTGRY